MSLNKYIQRHYTSHFSLIHNWFSKLRNERDQHILPFKKNTSILSAINCPYTVCKKRTITNGESSYLQNEMTQNNADTFFDKWQCSMSNTIRQTSIKLHIYLYSHHLVSYRDAVIHVIRSAVQFTDWQVLTSECVCV